MIDTLRSNNVIWESKIYFSFFSVYVPKKGNAKCVQGVNQLSSSIGNVLKVEENRKNGTFSDTGSVVNKRIDFRDRQGCDIFNFSNVPESNQAAGKKRHENH